MQLASRVSPGGHLLCSPIFLTPAKVSTIAATPKAGRGFSLLFSLKLINLSSIFIHDLSHLGLMLSSVTSPVQKVPHHGRIPPSSVSDTPCY